MCCLGAGFSDGLGSVKLIARVNDLQGFFQPK